MSKVINEQWRTLRLNALQAAAIVLEMDIDTLPNPAPPSVRAMAERIKREVLPLRERSQKVVGHNMLTGERRVQDSETLHWTLEQLRAWLESTPDLAHYRPAVLFGDRPVPTGDGLSRLVGLLALVIAEKGGRYRRGGKPNVNQIAEAVLDQIWALQEAEALPDLDSRGLGNSKIREHIAAGLTALEK